MPRILKKTAFMLIAGRVLDEKGEALYSAAFKRANARLIQMSREQMEKEGAPGPLPLSFREILLEEFDKLSEKDGQDV